MFESVAQLNAFAAPSARVNGSVPVNKSSCFRAPPRRQPSTQAHTKRSGLIAQARLTAL
jgi:hypothetical protein